MVGYGSDACANCEPISSIVGSSAGAGVAISAALGAKPSRRLVIMCAWAPLTSSPFFTTTLRMQPVHIVGGGLAGCEAAWQLAGRGVPAVIHEMRPVRMTDAH